MSRVENEGGVQECECDREKGAGEIMATQKDKSTFFGKRVEIKSGGLVRQ